MIKIVLGLLLPLWMFAGDIEWSKTFADAEAKAKLEAKPLLVVITSESCRWCRKLESTTLSDDKIIDKVNSGFVAVHVTRDKSVYPKNLTAKMVPMSYFLDNQGKILYSMPGYWPTEDYDTILDDALTRYKKGKE